MVRQGQAQALLKRVLSGIKTPQAELHGRQTPVSFKYLLRPEAAKSYVGVP